MEKTLLDIKHHSRYALISLLLETCEQAKTKAEIYWTRPKQYSYTFLGKLISKCVQLGFLSEKDGKYCTTVKGNEYVRRFAELLKFLDESQKQVGEVKT